MMHSLDEIGLIPTQVSEIEHRRGIYPFIKSPFGGNKLPVFVAPMTCILNAESICTFSRSEFEPILPVTSSPLTARRLLPNGNVWGGWTAMTLEEFKYYFNGCMAEEYRKHYVLIDVANGHMKELYTCVRDAKQEYGDHLTVMIGNIANPNTYIDCCEAGVDYVRVGIGGGSGCTTSVKTGIHASMPYLLEEIKKIKLRCEGSSIQLGTKIVADGGVNTIAKAIKCLALGADYVMMGQCFAQCEEGTTNNPKFTYDTGKDKVTSTEHLYYGQASTNGQYDRFGILKSEPEGMAKWVPVKYTLEEFGNKFEAALRSAMSYCGAHNLEEFIGKVKYEYMTPSEFSAFIK